MNQPPEWAIEFRKKLFTRHAERLLAEADAFRRVYIERMKEYEEARGRAATGI